MGPSSKSESHSVILEITSLTVQKRCNSTSEVETGHTPRCGGLDAPLVQFQPDFQLKYKCSLFKSRLSIEAWN